MAELQMIGVTVEVEVSGARGWAIRREDVVKGSEQ